MSDANVDARLAALESKLGRLEQLLATVNDKLDRSAPSVDEARRGLQAWVTEYVSLRLQQLVPETCEHPEREADETLVAEGAVLPGTRIRCTDEVIHRLGRIPIPFVRQMVAEKVAETARAEKVGVVDVPFFSLCAHHFLPFFGSAHVAYIPGDRIVGLSKLARLVDFYARRPQVQERMTEQIVACLNKRLAPKGAMVVLRARHFCMEMRGVSKPGVITTTSALSGAFEEERVRQEFLSLLSSRPSIG